MKKTTKQLTLAICVATLTIAAYPIYAAAKNSCKVTTQTTTQKGNTTKAVINQSPTDPFDNNYAGWDPFAEFIQMRQQMNNLLNSTFNHYQANPRQDDTWMDFSYSPACDIQIKDNKYIITMDLPGMEKSDIKIKLNDGVLSVEGKRNSSIKKEDKGRVILQERTQGSFSRVIKLANKVKQDEVEATYKNGTLTLVIPMEKKKDNSISIPIK